MANKLYSVALHYQIWIDVEAKDETEAEYYARNANFTLDLKEGERNNPNITIVGVEYNDLEPLIYEYPD
jgi:hypothetical protein